VRVFSALVSLSYTTDFGFPENLITAFQLLK
jgi:hypothetical protein